MPPSRSWAKIMRACDSCRQRKVKCDATEMCANCRISMLPCQYTSTPKKRGPKGSRSSTPRVPMVVAHEPQPQPLQSIQEASIGIGIGVLHGSYGPADEDHQVWLSPISCPEQQQRLGEETSTPTLQPGGLATNPRNTFALPVAEADLGPTAARAQAVRDGLLVLLSSALLPLPALQVMNTCIDLYMQYTFPTAPMVHEPTLRASAVRFFSSTGATEVFRANSREEETANIRAFTLLTALCASVASVMPESLLPYRQILARPCLDASRDMLKAFEDFDIEHPNSTSIATRILHSTALQQITGKTTLAYYSLGQATLLIRHMRLHSEEALKAHDALEIQLLRSMFWQMYAADKASACLGSRPFLIHELLLDEEITPPPSGEPHIPLLDTTKPWYERTFEERLFVGFRFLPRLWSSAASLLFDLKAHGRGDQDADKTRLTQAYIEFLSIIDDLPHWLQAANVIISRDDGEAAQFQKTAFWVQRCTVHVTYQCLRLVILQQCIDSKAWDIMGLNDQVLTLPMTKMGIVHEFVQTLDDIPFIYLQVKGEPTVERIRRVGSVLLEIIDNVSNETIIARAEHYVTRLLDLLARLESKSSDVLTELKELSQARLGSRPSGQRSL